MHQTLKARKLEKALSIIIGTGYTLNYNSGRCEDDDECALGLHNCDKLGSGYICRNTQ